jgi:hypothetical protein
LRKAIWRFFKKLKVELPYDQALPFLGIYPKEQKSAFRTGGVAQAVKAPA